MIMCYPLNLIFIKRLQLYRFYTLCKLPFLEFLDFIWKLGREVEWESKQMTYQVFQIMNPEWLPGSTARTVWTRDLLMWQILLLTPQIFLDHDHYKQHEIHSFIIPGPFVVLSCQGQSRQFSPGKHYPRTSYT